MIAKQSMRYTTILLALLSFGAAISTMINISMRQNQWMVMIFTMIFALMISTFLSFFLRILQSNPTPLRFGLVGPPGAGKTVYLSMLFHEIQARKDGAVSFQPYGVETVEEVTRNVNMLTRGEWLPATEPGSVFPFRANARISIGLFPRRYTVEIGDFAGEHVRELDPSSEEWFHRTKYFEYIASSDVLLLAIDGHRLVNGTPADTGQMVNNMIASCQVLLDAKGLQPGQKTVMPVAVLILKADQVIAKNLGEDDIRNRIHRLLSLCEIRCHRTKLFFVSAVGQVREDGSPPVVIEPINVCEPVLWALRAVRS